MVDLRILDYDPLIPAAIISREFPLTKESKRTISKARKEISEVMAGRDDRLVVIVGPCSIHDVTAALEYGALIKRASEIFKSDLILIMRAYFEKPRTTVGWKGLINDPFLDGSFHINDGLKIARKLLCDLTDSGVPVGCELLDTISPQYICDLVSWAAIGARTTECQLHREMASGVSCPVGFKNGTDGNVDIAVDAIFSASNPHHFICVNHQGLAAIAKSSGNDTCHVILRGGKNGTNYDEKSLREVKLKLLKSNVVPRIMIDCSHGNSKKVFANQLNVVLDISEQLKTSDDLSIMGVMIESNIVEGNQKVPLDLSQLVYGKSITDACVNFETTIEMFEILAEGVRQRRDNLKK
jgi:3-deoxy-7-phosphoheptulonate synthase